MFGFLPVVSLLLTHKVDVDKSNSDGRTALHISAMNAHNDVVKYLIECGAKMNKLDKNGMSPLHCTSLNNFRYLDY